MIQTLDKDLSEFEFEKPCEHPPCDNPAKYAVWTAHGMTHCPASLLRCEECTEMIKKVWETYVQDPLITCPRCNERLMGNLSDRLRIIRL